MGQVDRVSQANTKVQRRLSGLGWRSYSDIRYGVLIALMALAGGLLLSALGGFVGATTLLAIPALLTLILIFCLRGYVLLAGITVVAAIFLDFYQLAGRPLHEPVVALALALLVVGVLFFIQSEEMPWVSLRHLRFWAVFLVVAALAIPRGGSLSQTVSYYVTVLAAGLVMYALGTQVTRNFGDLRWLVMLMTMVAAFIALHTIVQGVTGRFLFATGRQTDYLSAVSGFHLSGTTVTRAGSFLLNPDWNGLYLAMSLFPAAGLIFTGTTRAWRIFAAVTCGLLLLALLFTFTTSSWLAAAVGFGFFLFLGVPKRYRWWTFGGLVTIMLVITALFYREVGLLYAHATDSNESSLRLGAWETALRIIRAYPLTGIGMGYTLYLDRAQRFRVALQIQALAHPHNSYLELAAFAGLPVLLAFLALLGVMAVEVARVWRKANRRQKPLIGGIISGLVVLCVNSFFINGWTLPPFVCLAWLLIGAVTSRAMQSVQAMEWAKRETSLPVPLKPTSQPPQRGGLSGLLLGLVKEIPDTPIETAEPARAKVTAIIREPGE